MPHSVRTDKAKLAGESAMTADRRLHHTAKRSAVLGMDHAKSTRDGRRFSTVGIQAENPIVLVGPKQLTGAWIPAPTPGVADALSVRQECFAALQVGIEPCVLE